MDKIPSEALWSYGILPPQSLAPIVDVFVWVWQQTRLAHHPEKVVVRQIADLGTQIVVHGTMCEFAMAAEMKGNDYAKDISSTGFTPQKKRCRKFRKTFIAYEQRAAASEVSRGCSQYNCCCRLSAKATACRTHSPTRGADLQAACYVPAAGVGCAWFP